MLRAACCLRENIRRPLTIMTDSPEEIMAHFKNFKVVTILPAPTIVRELDHLDEDYEKITHYVPLDKVYLETFRGDSYVEREKMKSAIDFFKAKGVEVSGAITTCIPDQSAADRDKQRLFETFCWSDEKMRARMKEISEYTASLFDEVILDDYFFTNCTCEACRRNKGKRSWTQFRLDTLEEVSRDLVVGPAKKINPKCRLIVKFPNWRESYHGAGYNPEKEKDIFDAVYTGTETRATAYQDQHLPRYASYSLMRWMDNAAPGRNGGGWFDPFQCFTVDTYNEQMYFTAFSRPKEIMFFSWHNLVDNRFTGPSGMQLGKIDRLLTDLGSPAGIPVYLPFNADGENHVEDHLGMHGFAFEPTPYFPEFQEGGSVFVTESSLQDPDVLEKITDFAAQGGKVFATTGFMAKAEPAKWEEISSARLTGRHIPADRYWLTDDYADYVESGTNILFPEIQHSNNRSWVLLNAGRSDFMTPIYLYDSYGKGGIYTISVPENPADLSLLPPHILDAVKKSMNAGGIYVTGRNVSLFVYDNDTFLIYQNVKEPIRPEHVTVHIQNETAKLVRIGGDPSRESSGEIPLRRVESSYNLQPYCEWVADIAIEPGEFLGYRIVR